MKTLVILLAIASISAHGSEVTVPIKIKPIFLQSLAEQILFAGPDQSAELLADESGCNELNLSEPELGLEVGQVKIIARTRARSGTPIADNCISLLDWEGFVELFLLPEISSDGTRVEFSVADSNLFNQDMKKGLLSRKVWDWGKEYVHPHMASFVIDLSPAINELRAVLPMFLTVSDLETTNNFLASMKLTDVQADTDVLTASVKFDMPDHGITSVRSTEEPALSPAEIEAVQKMLDKWDVFITFVIKHAATVTSTPVLRQAFLDVLIEARHEIVEALTSTHTTGEDPVRGLFLSAWSRLAPLMDEAGSGLPGERALQFLSFVAASDALQAIDQLGEAVNWEISVDGLRRLARTIKPDAQGDVLQYEEGVDSELRDLFNLGTPVENQQSEPQSLWFPLEWFVSDAQASTLDSPASKELNDMVAGRKNLKEYLPLVKDLLHDTVSDVLREKSLDAEFHKLFRPLVLATAWQESCWRQYVIKNAKKTPIQSHAGAVGMMQVMPRVWRGFYDTKALASSIAYNAVAGAEILHHYLVRYAISKGEHTKTGKVDNLARATYAAYNGGPRHLRRYRREATSASLREIDESFWKKFNLMKSGNELAVVNCFGG